MVLLLLLLLLLLLPLPPPLGLRGWRRRGGWGLPAAGTTTLAPDFHAHLGLHAPFWQPQTWPQQIRRLWRQWRQRQHGRRRSDSHA